ncbi:ribose-5-phosphate isomerase [Clostridium grantii]|uniref:Uncharacterized protein n=1 Tax=Clostridium grantii DSM 8605 TaxID=1121316 RepID=A0A1M5TLD3_9CLOT|nr:ribose-5-phosphate isomerase [Clostridium grantii]SHH51193.1 hypothetical protein SAMN02745207_01352 [Clostridium grantii DSM 8605]
MFIKENYETIIKVICDIKGIKRKEIIKILEDREYRYLLFLVLYKYNCSEIKGLSRDFIRIDKRKLRYNIKKGEERLLVNRNFRQMYFEVEKKVKKLI